MPFTTEAALSVDALPVPVFIHDQRGCMRDVNTLACASLGYSRAELLALGVADVEADFSLLQAQEQWRRLEHQASLTLRGQHKRKNGSTFPVEIQLGLWHRGAEPLYLCLVHDISRRQQIENALRRNELFIQSLYQHAPMGIGIADLDGHLLQWNKAYSTLLGYNELELQGLPLTDLIHPEDLAGNQRLLAQLKAGELPHFSLESRYVHSSGQIIWVFKHDCLMPDGTGMPRRLMDMVWDISARHEAELALEACQAMRKEGVAPGRRAPAELALDYRSAARQANPSPLHQLGELNQPLNALLLFAEAGLHLLNEPRHQRDKLQHCLESIAQQARCAAQQLHQITHLSPPQIASPPSHEVSGRSWSDL